MDPRSDQNSPLNLATFILAFMQTLQNQVKENVVGWQRQTGTQILAATTQFWDNLEKDKEHIKDCWVGCSELFPKANRIIPALANLRRE